MAACASLSTGNVRFLHHPASWIKCHFRCNYQALPRFLQFTRCARYASPAPLLDGLRTPQPGRRDPVTADGTQAPNRNDGA